MSEVIWKRIEACQGQTFRTKTGLPFTYEIVGSTLVPSRTRYHISRSDFKKASRLGPTLGPGDMQNFVRGPSYVWAILHDKRISSDE